LTNHRSACLETAAYMLNAVALKVRMARTSCKSNPFLSSDFFYSLWKFCCLVSASSVYAQATVLNTWKHFCKTLCKGTTNHLGFIWTQRWQKQLRGPQNGIQRHAARGPKKQLWLYVLRFRRYEGK